MGIFTDNPVLRREVRARLRLRKLAGNRPLAWATGAAVLVIAWFYGKGLVGIAHGEAATARDLWSYLVVFLLLLIVVIAPALLSTAITQEREQQTWEALTTTHLSAAEVLLGKWLARLSLVGLPALVLLPFLIGCAVKGGIGFGIGLAALLFLAVTAGAYGVLGLLCSFLTRKTVTATVVALCVTLFLCVGTTLLSALLSGLIRDASADYSYHDPAVMWVNPFYALFALIALLPGGSVGAFTGVQDAPGAVVAVYLVVTLLSAGGALAYMISRYRRSSRE